MFDNVFGINEQAKRLVIPLRSRQSLYEHEVSPANMALPDKTKPRKFIGQITLNRWPIKLENSVIFLGL